MKHTPASEMHNYDLLRMIPSHSMDIIEIGCGSGALAREIKKANPACSYLGIDIEAEYLDLAKRHCDQVECGDIDEKDSAFYASHTNKDLWIFGDTLEHLRNPWKVLEEVRKVIPKNGSVAASIPNAQHWSVFAKLSIGDFRYVDSGIFDRTHLRWFTRKTIHEMFSGAGFEIIQGEPRIFEEPLREKFLPLIGELAGRCGLSPQEAMNDALAFQYVLRAVPIDCPTIYADQ